MRARESSHRGGPLRRPVPFLRLTLAGFLVLVAPLAARDRALAGAWTEPEGGAYARITGAAIETRERFDAAGRRVAFGAGTPAGDDASYRSRDVRLYGEYGFRDGVTLFGSIGYKILESGPPGARAEASGLADAVLGARLSLQRHPAPVSLSLEAKIPTGYEPEDEPALGSGTIDVAARVLAGYSFGRAYATADAGFRVRAGGFRDELLYSGEVGSRLVGPAYARVVVRGEHALGAATSIQGAIFDPGLASPRRVTLEGVVGIDLGGGVSLEGGMSRALSGRDALAGSAVELGLVMLLAGRGH
jgi:hypothetical protein